MKAIGLSGLALMVAAIGCDDSSATAPTTPPSDMPNPSGSSMFDTLMGEASTHVPIEGTVIQENIVADEAGKAAATDAHLKNAWGLAFNPAGPAWVSSTENGSAQVYDQSGTLQLEVAMPPASGGDTPAAPTGQLFNRSASSAFMGDLFIFVTEDGTVAGWQPANDGTAVTRVDNSANDAIYKGVAVATPLTAGGRGQLYATNFHAGTIDVFDDRYAPVSTPGDFRDPDMAAGFAPFNIYGVGPLLIVAYAKQDENAEDDVDGPGNGFVDVFSADGFFLQRLISGGQLNSPWGMVFAPNNDRASLDLAVGNFGDGMINVYNLTLTGSRVDARWESALADASGNPLVIDGLWALAFGSGAGGFAADELYFTAGPNDEANGLFGSLAFAGARR